MHQACYTLAAIYNESTGVRTYIVSPPAYLLTLNSMVNCAMNFGSSAENLALQSDCSTGMT